MTSLSDPDDAWLQQLAHLPAVSPDGARTRELRLRCHAALRQRQEQSQRAATRRRRLKPIAAALIGCLCAVYVWSLVATLIAIRQLLD